MGKKQTLRLERPDGTVLVTQGWIEFSLHTVNNVRDDGIACLLRHDVQIEEVPAGTEVWLADL
jgi:hypothetical protein